MLLFSPKTTIFWTQRVYSRSWAFPVTRNRCVVRSSFYEPACYISLETRTICFLSLARICFKRTRLWRKKRICRLKKKAILSELLRRKNAVPLRIGFHGWRTRYDNFGLLTIIGYCIHVNLLYLLILTHWVYTNEIRSCKFVFRRSFYRRTNLPNWFRLYLQFYRIKVVPVSN